MHAAFGTVVVVVSLIALVVALIALARSNRTWADYGKGRLIMDRDQPTDSPAAAAERDEEILAMLHARNERRARRGEPALDVQEELARLTGPGTTWTTVDPELREEIRQLVEARNHRRVRAGKDPLDVEAEVAREIERLSRG